MKKLKIENIEVSNLCLGGGKMVDMPLDVGKGLVNKALSLGINVFDCHHRYGNCEKTVESFDGIIKMTKISSYKPELHSLLVWNSRCFLRNIDIFWVSDLDGELFYQNGKKLFLEYQNQFPLIGINTENPDLAFRFVEEVPSCDLFMVPLSIGQLGMIPFIKYAKEKGKKIFLIKIFRDGLQLKENTKEECLDFVKKVSPDVVLLGTSNEQHLEELVNYY